MVSYVPVMTDAIALAAINRFADIADARRAAAIVGKSWKPGDEVVRLLAYKIWKDNPLSAAHDNWLAAERAFL